MRKNGKRLVGPASLPVWFMAVAGSKDRHRGRSHQANLIFSAFCTSVPVIVTCGRCWWRRIQHAPILLRGPSLERVPSDLRDLTTDGGQIHTLSRPVHEAEQVGQHGIE